ncbi:hypothetical protein Pan44_37070 [Caulifigura coniformis]|uniref:Uncharacterized protein n=1 Tax=Caulifigura coniformis TaxID=2527983 RepID=A0A517SHR7_9PLAN|nr:hypothetical protein [Caulifigura coniformis]QDT55661.1 hypothetical protein Pan44_37070 [Caulifigura coniformis]
MSLYTSKTAARDEALRIAIEFVAAHFAGDHRWEWDCCEPQPDINSKNYLQRKTVVKWSIAVRLVPKSGGTFDGGPTVSVDIVTKEARFQ